MCIEFNGKQHYESISYFGGDELFEVSKIRYNIKREYCISNSIKFIEISYRKNIKNKLEECLNI
jgi:hypothetical protein